MRLSRQRSFILAAAVLGFYMGAATDWWLREKIAPRMTEVFRLTAAAETSTFAPRASADKTAVKKAATSEPSPAATTGRIVTPPPVTPTISSGLEGAIEELGRRDLRLPLDHIKPESFRGSFAERRGGRAHEAADMLAPRGTPVHAVEDGTIAKLFNSQAGGITVYQFDPGQRFVYYYAHLDRYAPLLAEGQRVRRDEVIGFVGTSGNAPANTPHLHFAVFVLTPERRWWDGRAIDPFLVFSR